MGLLVCILGASKYLGVRSAKTSASIHKFSFEEGFGGCFLRAFDPRFFAQRYRVGRMFQQKGYMFFVRTYNKLSMSCTIPVSWNKLKITLITISARTQTHDVVDIP